MARVFQFGFSISGYHILQKAEAMRRNQRLVEEVDQARLAIDKSKSGSAAVAAGALSENLFRAKVGTSRSSAAFQWRDDLEIWYFVRS